MITATRTTTKYKRIGRLNWQWHLRSYFGELIDYGDGCVDREEAQAEARVSRDAYVDRVRKQNEARIENQKLLPRAIETLRRKRP